ncbi:hypothetical protein, partial [Pseudophaeobacter profundi]|uniref:hypothetical protein n=1 Tax=Pseudophaeobacter profundi TaxID=3034152 RepID=UPI002432E984
VIGVDNSTFPNNTMTNVTELHLVYNGSLFSVPLNNSYTCASVAPLSLNGTTTPTTNATVPGKLTVANVHVQAFGKKNETTFRTSMDCASSETPDIVPIVVGLVLAGLVV